MTYEQVFLLDFFSYFLFDSYFSSWDPEPCHLFQNSLSIFQSPQPEFWVTGMEQNLAADGQASIVEYEKEDVMQQELDIEKNIKYQEMKNNYCI